MRVVAMLTTIMILAGCVAQNEPSALQATAYEMLPDFCAAQLGSHTQRQPSELDSNDIRIVNWNIQKGGDPHWAEDLASFISEPDLMIFQEASRDTDAWDIFAADYYRSFARGYRTPGALGSVTGVMTLSSIAPLTR